MCHIHSLYQSVKRQHILSGFPPWSNVLSRTSIAPALLKFQVFEKSNQCVNRGSVNHTFPGRLCQDQLCIHHSLRDLCVRSKSKIQDRKETEMWRQIATDTRRAADFGRGVRIWCVKREKPSDSSIAVSVTVSVLHPGLLVCPSSPSRCSPNEGVKGWQVPGGAARSPGGVRFLWGQAVVVCGWNEPGCSGHAQDTDGTSERQSHPINFIYGQWQAATPAWGGHNQLSGYYPLLTTDP